MKRIEFTVMQKSRTTSKDGELCGDQIVFNSQTKNQIAWIEEKSRLDHRVVDQLRKQSLIYGDKIMGFLKVGMIYIPEKSVLSQSEFIDQIAKHSKRRLSNRQVALLYYINDVVIPSDCTRIANEWGSISSNAIYTHYNLVVKVDNKPNDFNEKIKRSIAKDLKIIKETPGLVIKEGNLLNLINRFQQYMY